MTRTDTTKFLSNILVSTRLSGFGKYWAREVTLDYGTHDVRRIDFLQFCPENQVSVSGIEKGSFVAYEIKSCIEDVFSGNGLNFVAEKNYIVLTMETWKKLISNQDKLFQHVSSCNPSGSCHFGILVAVPDGREETEEFDSPTPLDTPGIKWNLRVVRPCREGARKRAMAELLFCMLRAGQRL